MQHLWAFDYTGVKLQNSGEFPLEIAVVNFAAPKDVHVFYIKYPCNYFNNFTQKLCCPTHGCIWQDNDETLYSAIYSITHHLITSKNAKIFVNSDDKRKFLRPWFKNNVSVLNTTNEKLLCKKVPLCSRHVDNGDCAKKGCIQLMLNYNDNIMYSNNPMSLCIYHIYNT
jgi:hypothetical protein